MFSLSAQRILRKQGIRNDRFWTRAFLFKPFFRRIPFYLDLWALQRSQYWSRAELDAHALARVTDVVQEAAKLPFWKDHFARSGFDPHDVTEDSFSRITPTSRVDFQREGTLEWIDTQLLSESVADHTSGSTGQPFDFFLDRSYELRSFAVVERMIRDAAGGVRLPVVSLRARQKPGFSFLNNHLFFIQNYNGVKHRIDELKTYLDGFGTDVVTYGFPSIYVEIARLAEEKGYHLPIRAALSTGESIRQSDRELVEKRLHTKCRVTYATRELSWISFECDHNRYHLHEEWCLTEVVDQAGNPLPYGSEGRIILTSFDNRVMPFIRYENGDRGVISDEPCPCGRTLRTISVSGREIEFITFEDGRSVSALDISTIFDAFASSVRQFTILQTAPYAFTATVIPASRFETEREQLTARLVGLLHPSAQISWIVVDEIPAAATGKAVTFVAYTART